MYWPLVVYVYRGQSGVRTEKLSDEWFEHSSATSTVSEFYSSETHCTTNSHDDDNMDTQSPAQGDNNTHNYFKHTPIPVYILGLQKVVDFLPKCSLSCLSGLIHHLRVFKLEQVLKLTR